VIRQAISCDICGAEKRQTNHWFVTYEQGGELRVSGWSSRHRLKPGSKHLCGQTCLHKLVDEYMAKSIAVRSQRVAESEETEIELPETARDVRAASASVETDRSLTSAAAFADEESSARLLTPPTAVIPTLIYRPGEPKAASLGVPAYLNESRAGSPGNPVFHSTDKNLSAGTAVFHAQPEVLTMPARSQDLSTVPADTLRYASRRWRAEAWERERERELRGVEKRPDVTARRTSA
jgi:hypothetical protein